MKNALYGIIVTLALGILTSTFAQAEEKYNLLSASDFVAPTYGGDSSSFVPDRAVGSIIYNASSGYFEGLGLDNNWHVFNTTNPVISTGTTERIERALLPTSGTTITSMSGGWLSSLGHANGSGQYQLNFTSSFSAAPTCTANSSNSNNTLVIASTSVSSVVIYSYDRLGNFADGSMHVICIGPR
jgi:hypothetical protein